MNNMDGIAKQKFDVILIVDCSSSMRGERIGKVNEAISDIVLCLRDLQYENANVDFFLSVLTFATDAQWSVRSVPVQEYTHQPLRAGGQSNLVLAYDELICALKKRSAGGMMPDFGGVAPVLLLLSDGHSSGGSGKKKINVLKKLPWFKVAIKYAVAIGLNDERTKTVLQDFTGERETCLEACDPNVLKNIIKIVVLTASKVRTSSAGSYEHQRGSISSTIKQEIGDALDEIGTWDW